MNTTHEPKEPAPRPPETSQIDQGQTPPGNTTARDHTRSFFRWLDAEDFVAIFWNGCERPFA